MKKRILAFMLLFAMLFMLAVPAYGASDSATVTTSMKGNDVTITVKDGQAVATKVVAYSKNTVQTYDVEGYTVTIEYNGSGVKKASIVGYPSAAPAAAPAAAPVSPAPSDNTPAPKPGVSVSGADMTWNKADEAAAKAFTQSASKDTVVPKTALIPVNSSRTNASGDKIPSNAHSGDFPGIYFYWNDKQKDDGILKVDPALFEMFKDGKFYITAKNSNAYWDYWISPSDPKAVVTSEGYLLYQIPRYFMYSDKNNKTTKDELKNINMIFIGGDYKDVFLVIEKDWLDEDGNLVVNAALIGELNKKLSFDSNAGKLKLGLNAIKITDFNTAYSGKKLTVTEGAIAGYKTKLNPITLTVKYNDAPVKSVKFENQKLWAFIKISKTWDLLPGSTAPGAKFNIYDKDNNLVYANVDPGTYQVKEGTYKVVEIAISGYTADKESATVTVDAGKTGTVSFNNKEDRATIKPVKKWVGDELPAGVEAKLTNGYSFGVTKTVKAGTNVAFEEEDLPFLILGDYIYFFELESIELAKGTSAAQVVGAVDFTAEKDTAYTVYFTNKVTKKPLAADLTLIKVWQDENGNPLNKTGVFATVDADIAFTAPYVLGKNEDVVHGLDLATIAEDLSACAYEDSEYWYSFEQVSVAGNSGIVGPGGSYTITFTNKLVKVPKPADLTIVKVWLDDSGQPLSKTGVFATVDADIAFTAPYVLGKNEDVVLGLDLATIAEDISACAYED
ncbi:MAG: prealbumin-like fold domain-containing protein, partial [Clostridiales bacterium]|nr:prealbumin-like fold domain-containing protein [Clostridiales bacterium]